MSCGCSPVFTDKEIDTWIVTHKLSERLMEMVRENPRAMQEMSGAELFNLVMGMEGRKYNTLFAMAAYSDKRVGDILKMHVARLVESHIAEQMKGAVPFEPIVIKQKDAVRA